MPRINELCSQRTREEEKNGQFLSFVCFCFSSFLAWAWAWAASYPHRVGSEMYVLSFGRRIAIAQAQAHAIFPRSMIFFYIVFLHFGTHQIIKYTIKFCLIIFFFFFLLHAFVWAKLGVYLVRYFPLRLLVHRSRCMAWKKKERFCRTLLLNCYFIEASLSSSLCDEDEAKSKYQISNKV